MALTWLLAGCAAAADDTLESSSIALWQACDAEPDYTADELVELANSEPVKRGEMPWSDAPPPDRSLYAELPSGAKLALDLYFPNGALPDSPAPVVYAETMYGRTIEATNTAISLYRAAGFVVAIGDPSGLGASFGVQPGILLDAQRRDQRELIAWLAAQPWANGQVAAIGGSVSAMLAEAMAGSGAPALRAAVIRATEWDQYSENLFPGGVPNLGMLQLLTQMSTMMQSPECVADLASCAALGGPIQPVMDDPERLQLQAALSERSGNYDGADFAKAVYRDDVVGQGSFAAVSPVDHQQELRDAAVPARVSASWLDGTTAEAALRRFAALPDAPMQVVIGATTHSGGLNADPFTREAFAQPQPSAAEQYGADTAFVQRVLAGETIERKVRFVVLGTDEWQESAVWPPRGVRTRSFHLAQDELRRRPAADSGELSYRVDDQTSTGPYNRWASQGGGSVYYGDRRLTPGQRLSFDAAPVRVDTDVIGSPRLCLSLTSDQSDGVVYAYLDDVAPDGRVTYLTEGLLRLLHRGPESDDCAAEGGTRSFERADGAPVVPGESMHVELPLLPTAARIERGHHLRLSLAGADAGTFPLISERPATWTVAWGGDSGSQLHVPLRPVRR